MYRKYGNKKITADGMTFDSKREYRRYCELKLLERGGYISDLKFQQKFVLIPEQREESTEVYQKGKNKGKLKPGKVIEKECSYIADFVYTEDGKTVVEDTKGFRTKDYIIKRKMMLHIHGIKIKEI